MSKSQTKQIKYHNYNKAENPSRILNHLVLDHISNLKIFTVISDVYSDLYFSNPAYLIKSICITGRLKKKSDCIMAKLLHIY